MNELKAKIACIVREMSEDPEEQCDKIADEIMELLNTRPVKEELSNKSIEKSAFILANDIQTFYDLEIGSVPDIEKMIMDEFRRFGTPKEELSEEALAMLLQNQDLLQDDILVGKVYRILSFGKCMDIAKAVYSRFHVPKAITWPKNSKFSYDYNVGIVACKKAVEKAKEQ